MLTCGILQALINRKVACRAWKCGPDYIDPMFHNYVLGIQGGNLDTWFLEGDGIRSLLADHAPLDGCTVIEGVMGFYDGVAGISTQASAYDVARVTDTPVILILDCRGASLSLAAVLKGFLEYKADHHIKGVILNRISAVLAERIRPLLEELGVIVLGYLPECEEARLESRHLGLKMPREMDSLRKNLNSLAGRIEKTIDLELLLELANTAPPLEIKTGDSAENPIGESPVRIGVARDEAFCFYYQENLALMERMGAILIPFSPLHDQELLPSLDGLLLGGGYPELYAAELEANGELRRQIRKLMEKGLPVLAECGGFLYLHDQLEGEDGMFYQMVGSIPGRAYKTGRLGRFGYIELKGADGRTSKILPDGERIRGHEFHYWDSTANGTDWVAQKPLCSRGWSCMHDLDGVLAGFPHLYYPSNKRVIKRWLQICRERKESQR